MTAADIRQKYLQFFASRGHKVIPSAPLVPENDPTTLFTSSGMQPLVPYLLGQPHPSGKRLVNSQKSFRAQDIDEVGNNRHTTFFEMLGNWSLGDYFKSDQLTWIFEFLTQELKLDPHQLYITVFAGNKSVHKDTESIAIWKNLFATVGINAKEGERIFAYPASQNWWSRAGEPDQMPTGEPGGPDSEVFYDFGQEKLIHENSIYKSELCHPNCGCGRYLEIANSVFMQYQTQPDGTLKELPKRVVDFGGGLERLTATVNDNPDIFQTDLFSSIIRIIEQTTGKSYADEIHRAPMRVIADHLKAATFLIGDGVTPSNKLQGYILRRLIRRSVVKLYQLQGKDGYESEVRDISLSVMQTYANTYFNPATDPNQILPIITAEAARFSQALDRGLKGLQKLTNIDGKAAFDLFQSYGFPWELTQELASERGVEINRDEFLKEFRKHQDLSRTAAGGMFKGGLADHSQSVVKLHTATHLLHAALRTVLGPQVQQKGSNITAERLRFDFTCSARLTEAERRKIEKWVNKQINRNLPVKVKKTTLDKAKQEGALAFFGERYGDQVTVYTIGDDITDIISQEVCGGPHVKHTGEIGSFSLGKDEAVGTGVRRVYARLT